MRYVDEATLPGLPGAWSAEPLVSCSHCGKSSRGSAVHCSCEHRTRPKIVVHSLGHAVVVNDLDWLGVIGLRAKLQASAALTRANAGASSLTLAQALAELRRAERMLADADRCNEDLHWRLGGKHCTCCGRFYRGDEFLALESPAGGGLYTPSDGGESLLMRQCVGSGRPCGNTLTLPLPK